MKIIIFGASGGTGQAVTKALLAKGHTVTAFARRPDALLPRSGQQIFPGDAMSATDVATSLPGHDAVLVSLGNSQNPFAMLLGARRTTPANICEVGTRNIVNAMTASGLRKLVVITAFGVGDTKAKAPLMNRLFFQMFLSEHMADKEKQEFVVKASGLDWTIVQPVALVDKPVVGRWSSSPDGTIDGAMISRTDLAAFVTQELQSLRHHGMMVTLSGAPTQPLKKSNEHSRKHP